MKNNRWWIYQKERFNLLQYVPMIAGFSFCAVSYSMHIRGAETLNLAACIWSFIVTLGWFMLLRVADEHKDYEDDLKYRPYRPVQRGLVSLKELKYIGIGIGIIQFLIVLFWCPKQLILLGVVYYWFYLMCIEFGNPKWLKLHPTIYLLSHMIITPLIDGFGASFEWIQSGETMIFPMFLFMLSSFCDGTTVEVGRKIRIPEDEEFGVDSYTYLWGIKRAVFTWIFCMTISFISTVIAGYQVGVGFPIACILSVLYIVAWYLGLSFIAEPTRKLAHLFETFSGIWMLVMYFSLGLLPFII